MSCRKLPLSLVLHLQWDRINLSSMWIFFRPREFSNFPFFMLTRSCHAKAMKWKLTFLGMCFKILAIERDDRLSVWLYRASVPMLFRHMTTYFRDLVFHSSLPLSPIIQVSLVCLWSSKIFFSHHHSESSFIYSFIHRRSYFQHVQHNGCTLQIFPWSQNQRHGCSP